MIYLKGKPKDAPVTTGLESLQPGQNAFCLKAVAQVEINPRSDKRDPEARRLYNRLYRRATAIDMTVQEYVDAGYDRKKLKTGPKGKK